MIVREADKITTTTGGRRVQTELNKPQIQGIFTCDAVGFCY